MDGVRVDGDAPFACGKEGVVLSVVIRLDDPLWFKYLTNQLDQEGHTAVKYCAGALG